MYSRNILHARAENPPKLLTPKHRKTTITCYGLADESYAKIILTDNGWLMVTDEELAEYLGEEDFTPPLDVENGKVTEPETDTLVPALEDVIELMPREEAALTEDDPVE